MKNLIARNLQSFLDSGRLEELGRYLEDLHPADIAEILEPLNPETKVQVFGLLTSEKASEVIVELSETSWNQVLGRVPVERLSEMVAEMDSDDAADVVAYLPDEDAATVLKTIEPEDSAEVRQLLLYDDDTAGGIMQLELIRAKEDETVAEVIARIREAGDDVQDLSYVFVVGDNDRLRGQASLRRLLLALPHQRMRDISEECELVVDVHEDQEQVAQNFQKYDLRSAPVVDEAGRLIGRITVDDVFDVIFEEVDEDFMRMAGTSEEEIYSDKISNAVRLRLPWLFVNLLGGLVSGYLMWIFRVALQDVLALITFIPVTMALGGSVGMQSSTIVVRGLAIGRVVPGQVLRVMFKELRVGLVMGLVIGLGGALLARFWHHRMDIGLIVGLAMLSAITLSSLLGAMVPLLFRRLGVDPALASGPFVTTCNDMIGVLNYMGIATLMLRLLA
jgi:magnesium transporter